MSHSIFSPSGSSMWANCAGSLRPSMNAKDSVSVHAAQGTVAHSLGEDWLNSGVRPDHQLGKVHIVDGFEITVDKTMLDYVEVYVNWCWGLRGDHYVETRVDFSDLTPIADQSGTADHAACEHGKLTITDLKYGQGVRVDAKNNTQLVLYAWGFFQQLDWLYDFQEIEIRICQPRLDHLDTWVISREELHEWAEWLSDRAHEAWQHDAPRTPGEKQCQWCPSKADCAAVIALQVKFSDGIFDDLSTTVGDMRDLGQRIENSMSESLTPDLMSLTVEQKAALLPFKSMVEKWWASLAEDLYLRALSGETVKGYKLVEGRSVRSFSDESLAAEWLKTIGVADETLYPRKLLSPAQAESALQGLGIKKKELPQLLAGIVSRTLGEPLLVVESDKRQALKLAADEVFTNLDDEL